LQSHDNGTKFYYFKEIYMSRRSTRLNSIAVAIMMLSATSLGYAKSHMDFKGESCPALPTLGAGLYVGGQVGYESMRAHRYQELTVAGSTLNISDSANASGWIGGLFVGYGMMLNPTIYLGAELAGNWSGANGTTSANLTGAAALNDSMHTEVNHNISLSLMPGYKLASNLLSYVRLGWNWASLTEKVSVFSADTLNTTGSKTSASTGFVLGLGMEALLVDNWSVRGEYNHTWYNDFTVSNALTGTDRVTPSDNQYSLGLVYHIA
jgi:outer membrane immunogenic protein